MGSEMCIRDRSMVAPTILCRRSECRGAPTGASLRVPHFPHLTHAFVSTGARPVDRKWASRTVGWPFVRTPPVLVLGMGCLADARQPEVRSSNLSPGQVSTSSRSSLLGLKKGIFFGGTSTRAPVLGLRPMRARLWRVWKLPNPRTSTLSPDRRARTMLSNMAQTTTSDSFRDIPMAW